jgi:hypothetical protein
MTLFSMKARQSAAVPQITGEESQVKFLRDSEENSLGD